MSGASQTLTIAGETITIERFQAAKAVRLVTLVGIVQRAVPEIQSEIAAFRRTYRAENVIELDRAQARMRFPRLPIVDDDGQPVLRTNGEIAMAPSPLDDMSEADWGKSGNLLRLYQTPEVAEIIAAVFPTILEKAEQPVFKLLALATMTNEDVARYAKAGEVQDRIDDVVQDRIERAYLDELMELAVVVAELFEGQVMRKARELGDRLGKLRRLVGMEEKTPTGSSPETSTTPSAPPEPRSSSSSSASEPDLPGLTPTASSDSPGTSSEPSASTSPATAS